MSLGGPAFSATFQGIVDQVRAAGVIMVAASGNDATNDPMYPAAFDAVVSVAATDIAGGGNATRCLGGPAIPSQDWGSAIFRSGLPRFLPSNKRRKVVMQFSMPSWMSSA